MSRAGAHRGSLARADHAGPAGHPSGSGVGSVWIAIARDGTVQRVDAKTGTIVASITVADPRRLLAAGCAPSSEHAYATGSFGLRACDAPSAVAAGTGAVWAVASSADAVVRIDLARNAVSDTIAVGFDASFLAVSDDAVWVSDYANDSVARVDPVTRQIVPLARISPATTATCIAPTRGRTPPRRSFRPARRRHERVLPPSAIGARSVGAGRLARIRRSRARRDDRDPARPG